MAAWHGGSGKLMNNGIEIGAVVVLRSESKKMTVTQIGNYHQPEGLMILCVWLDKDDRLNQQWLPLLALEKLTS